VVLLGISTVDSEYEVLLLYPTNMSHDCSLGFPVRVGVFFQQMPLVSSAGGHMGTVGPNGKQLYNALGIGHGWSQFEVRNTIIPRHFEVYIKISALKTDALLYYTLSLRSLVIP
jgi:hypothetical protein